MAKATPMKKPAAAKVKTTGSKKKTPVPKGLGKLRIGIVHGKTFDPVKVGTQPRNYPEKLKIKNNTGPNASGWGGQFMADVSTGLKMQNLHPDIIEVDFMRMDDISKQRLAKNHLTFNFWGDMSIAILENKLGLAKKIMEVQKDCGNTHHYPDWKYYEWVLHKSQYMKQCIKAGIPMIPTIFVDNGFKAKAVLKQIQAKGWKQFLVKPAYLSFFGNGVINGKTEDFVNDITPLLEYEKENKKQKEFLVQPYVLKPNGQVFDEIRNFFIEGEWQYSVFTHGTDYEGFWEQPPGALKEACKALAIRAYNEVKKVAKWEGKPMDTLLNRIDIGIVPDKSLKLGYKIFVNEIEPQMTTWLGRYCPFEIADKMAAACVNQASKAIRLSLDKGRKMPTKKENIKQLLDILDERLA
mmetsp:Transcript_67424/g.140880  ORF Transcript_67424/g.140880 Transcript_67424/m.140880 type:complete len:409 (+) Transcript_67424:119-1345(+)|eukprot:CAMPEP_0206453054 /NCGR_PEP_ID=MMETSP0324_2-20121206/20306_1 /ASSEMBLY_ACC=CAM_ASM_000836 /TAXON_ID=2866 /ORGANISM="Crypthecodinium cohnii, Strain Seligo" /LENGTH=408 /DNA_ID=CAMNT_0053923249 /DNA_START=118 /DNA_END=1344 /DNA_ORIENTATION=+